MARRCSRIDGPPPRDHLRRQNHLRDPDLYDGEYLELDPLRHGEVGGYGTSITWEGQGRPAVRRSGHVGTTILCRRDYTTTTPRATGPRPPISTSTGAHPSSARTPASLGCSSPTARVSSKFNGFDYCEVGGCANSPHGLASRSPAASPRASPTPTPKTCLTAMRPPLSRPRSSGASSIEEGEECFTPRRYTPTTIYKKVGARRVQPIDLQRHLRRLALVLGRDEAPLLAHFHLHSGWHQATPGSSRSNTT